MLLRRFLTRHRLTLTALLTTSMLMTGCGTIISHDTGPHEKITLPTPSHACIATDGSLLLAVHIDRQMQSSRSGWHWIIADPATTQMINSDPTLIAWSGNNINATIEPPLLSKGLQAPYPLPDGYASAHTLLVESRQYAGQFALTPLDSTDLLNQTFTLSPSSATYYPPIRTALGQILLAPAEGAIILVTLPLAIGVILILSQADWQF